MSNNGGIIKILRNIYEVLYKIAENTSTHLYSAGQDVFQKIYSDSGLKAGIKFSERTSGAYGIAVYHDGNTNKFHIVYIDANGNLATPYYLTIDRQSDLFGLFTDSPTCLFDLNADKMRIRTSKTPSSASDTGNQGDICWDSNYIYICVASNTWKRVAISTW